MVNIQSMAAALPAYTPNARQRQNRNRSESEMSAVIMFNSTATNLPPILRRDNDGKNFKEDKNNFYFTNIFFCSLSSEEIFD